MTQVRMRGHKTQIIASPKYFGTQIIARDSQSNRLTSEDTEYNLSVYSVCSSNLKPVPLYLWIIALHIRLRADF